MEDSITNVLTAQTAVSQTITSTPLFNPSSPSIEMQQVTTQTIKRQK